MTREEVIIHLKGIKSYIKGGYMTEPEKREVEALNMAIKALDQEQDILFKIFCIVDPLSIMSTTELEHKAIMQIAEMLEPLCLPESEE